MSWQKVTLSELGRVVTGKTPSRARPDYFGDEYPFVTPSDFGFMHYYCTDVAEGVSELGFEKHKNQTSSSGRSNVRVHREHYWKMCDRPGALFDEPADQLRDR